MIKRNKTIITIIIFFLFVITSFLVDLESGKEITKNFLSFSKTLGLMLPPIFILIGLFEVWVKRETVEKHLGAGPKSFIIVILLASTMIGGIIVALPVAISLWNKGARASLVYTFIFASAICRIPMTFFEASFVGISFTLIRLGISIPLAIFFGIIMERIIPTPNLPT